MKGWRRWLAGMTILAAGLPAFGADVPAGAEADPDKPAREVLNRWLGALGGARNIAQLKTADFRSQIDFGNGVVMEGEMRADINGGYRYDYETPRFGRLTQAFDGRQTWQQNKELGFGALTAQEHAMNLGGLDFRSPIYAMRSFPERKLLPDETINGRPLQVMDLADQNGVHMKWYFERATGHRVRVAAMLQGEPVVVDFADFRPVPGSGVVQPYRTERTVGPRKTVIVMRDMLFNDAMDRELFAVPHGAQEDNAQIERIMHYNRQFVGQEALAQLQTRRTKATTEVTTAGMKYPTVVSQKRPNLMLLAQEVPGMGPTWQGYNGQVAWEWSELQGYRLMQGAEFQQMLSSADMDGPLRLSEKCPLRRLLEEKADGDRRIIGIAMAALSGPVGNFYFDTRTYELVRVETFMQAGADGQLKVTADFTDYRRVDGVRLPFRTTITNPAVRIVTTVVSVEHNVPLEDKIFQPRKE